MNVGPTRPSHYCADLQQRERVDVVTGSPSDGVGLPDKKLIGHKSVLESNRLHQLDVASGARARQMLGLASGSPAPPSQRWAVTPGVGLGTGSSRCTRPRFRP